MKSSHTKRESHVLSLVLSFGCVAAAIAFFGCPVKFWTGVSCPGCGMTRAWLSALTLHLDLAFAYHPLFWSIPPIFLLVAVRNRLPKRLFFAVISVILIAFIVVWVIRLAKPFGPNMPWSGMLDEDVVSVERPAWLSFITALLTHL